MIKLCTIVFLLGVSCVLMCPQPALATVEWVTVYETDFATDQGWQTGNVNNYYLDGLEDLGSADSTGAYKTNQLECSDEDAYHLLPQTYGAGTPLRMEFDVRMDSFQYPGQLNISLNNPGITTVGYPGHDDEWPWVSITLSLSGSAKLQWADGIGPYEHPADAGVHFELWESFGGAPLLGREYHAIVEWLPDSGTLSAWVTGDNTNWSTTDSVPELGNAFNGIDRIAMSIVGDCNARPGHATGYFDNIVVQTPEPTTVVLLGLGGLGLLRRRKTL